MAADGLPPKIIQAPRPSLARTIAVICIVLISLLLFVLAYWGWQLGQHL